MANKFNFTTKLGLDTAGFKQGVNSARGAVATLKSAFLSLGAALGAGLGFRQFASSLKETAMQLSVANNTLKNVSYVTKYFKDGVKEVDIEVTNFSDNLEFVKKLAKDYSQDLVAVTDNFAKFTAASKKTSLELEDQRFVFESLTKAAAYYHLSADRTADMMNAITQMMSKGKVVAEELRRQLGNTLPGAFNLMAAAMGKSTKELETMMRNGELVATEALPKFAAMLNSVTQTAEFDSLQSSMNQLRNSWYELVEVSGAENMFKSLIDTGTSALSYIAENFDNIKASFVGLVNFIIGMGIFRFLKNGMLEWKAGLIATIDAAEIKLTRMMTQMHKLKASGAIYTSGSGAVGATMGATLTRSQINHMIAYNNELLKAKQAALNLGLITKTQFNVIKASVDRANMSLRGMLPSVNNLKVAMSGLSAVGQKIGAFFSSISPVTWALMAVGAVSALASKAKQAREEMEKIRNIAEDYANDSARVQGSLDEQAAMLRNNLKIVKDTKQEDSVRLRHLAEINKALGLTGKERFKLEDLDKIAGKYEEITKKVEDWIAATKKQALVQHYANQIAELTAKKAEAKRKQEKAWKTWSAWEAGDVGMIEGSAAKKEWSKLNAEIAQYDKAIKTAEADMKKAGVEMAEIFDRMYGTDANGGNGGDDDKKEETLEKLYQKYLKEKKKLDNQLREGAITQEQFNEAFDKLVQEYWKNAAAFGELSIDAIANKSNSGKALTKLEKWYQQLSEDARDALHRATLKEISEDLIKNADKDIEDLSEALEKELEEIAKKDGLSLELDLKVLGGDFKVDPRQKRNPLMDYDKTQSEILEDEFKLSDDWLDDIKNAYGDLIEESTELGFRTEIVQKELDILSEKYRYAAREASTLEAAMNYQKIVEDIKEVKKEINGLVYSGVKDFATSLDRVVSAWDTLKEAMQEGDATGWEKFMAIFNLMTQIVDSAIGIWQTITTIQELSAKLGSAKIAEQAALNALLKEELALRMAAAGASNEEIAARMAGITALLTEKGLLAGILGIKQAEGAQIATNTALKTGEAAASTAAAAASAGEAVAGATASGSKMPFPLNLVAIAAGVAAVVGALSMIGKFANGGIVGGNSKHGDRNIARVNSGEMILNKAQQGTLWGLLNGKGSIGGNVEFKIRGADLVGTINNYSKKISK